MIVYRCVRLHPNGELTSVYRQGFPWGPGVHRAKCTYGDHLPSQCGAGGCGFYAFRRPGECLEWASSNFLHLGEEHQINGLTYDWRGARTGGHDVLIRCWASGEVIEGSLGIRCQEIEALAVLHWHTSRLEYDQSAAKILGVEVIDAHTLIS